MKWNTYNSVDLTVSCGCNVQSCRWIIGCCLLLLVKFPSCHLQLHHITAGRVYVSVMSRSIASLLMRLYLIFGPLASAASCFYSSRLTMSGGKCCIAVFLLWKGHSTYYVWLQAYITNTHTRAHVYRGVIYLHNVKGTGGTNEDVLKHLKVKQRRWKATEICPHVSPCCCLSALMHSEVLLRENNGNRSIKG